MTTETGSILIGQLAKETGVPTKTIRYYEESGLLPEPPRTQAGYRVYGREAADLLRFIGKAQGLGLSLSDIKELAEVRSAGNLPCEHLRALLEAKTAELDERIREMRKLRDEMRKTMKDWDERVEKDQSSVVCPHIEGREVQRAPGASRAGVRGIRFRRPGKRSNT